MSGRDDELAAELDAVYSGELPEFLRRAGVSGADLPLPRPGQSAGDFAAEVLRWADDGRFPGIGRREILAQAWHERPGNARFARLHREPPDADHDSPTASTASTTFEVAGETGSDERRGDGGWAEVRRRHTPIPPPGPPENVAVTRAWRSSSGGGPPPPGGPGASGPGDDDPGNRRGPDGQAARGATGTHLRSDGAPPPGDPSAAGPDDDDPDGSSGRGEAEPDAAGQGARWPETALWQVPQLPDPFLPRPELVDRVLTALAGASGAPPGVVFLEGPGGWGKTTLAAEAARDPRLADRFPGGVYWFEIGYQQAYGEAPRDRRAGREPAAALLAERVNDLVEGLTGRRPEIEDPRLAGDRLLAAVETAAAGRPALVILDDVWEGQLDSFLSERRTITRLVTRLAPFPASRGARVVRMPPMTDDEAMTLLVDGVPGAHGTPGMPGAHGTHGAPGTHGAESAEGAASLAEPEVAELVRALDGWPLAIVHLNLHLRRELRVLGDDPDPLRVLAALEHAERALRDEGLSRFDDPHSPRDRRHRVAWRVVEYTLPDLTDPEWACLRRLAVSPPGVTLPRAVLARLWAAEGLSLAGTARLCDVLVDRLGVMCRAERDHDESGLRLHDAHLRLLRERVVVEIGDQGLRDLQAQFCDALAAGLPGAGAPAAAGAPDCWRCPDEFAYVWHTVPHHLYAAGRGDQLAALVCDLRWVTRKIAKCGVVAALADFELARELAGGGHHALMVAALAREVGRLAHVLPPGADADTVTAVLLDRIEPAGPLAGPVRALAAAYDRPWLRRVWSPPDVPHLALRRRLDDHASRITAGAVDPNRRWLATADDDGVVFVWDPVTFEPRFSLGDPANDRRSPVTASAASANGRMLVTAHQDATVRIWSPLTGRRRATIRVSEGVVRAVEFCPASRLLVTGADGGAARLWDAVRGEPGAPLLGHSATVRAVAFGPRGRNRWVATGGDDATVRVWNLPDGTRRHVLTGHAGPVRACAASADGRYLATAGDDATVRVWDPVRGQEVFPEPLRHDGPVHALAFSPDGTLLISGSDDRTVGVWNLFDGSRTDTLAVHDGPVRTVLLSPDGSVLLAASDDLVISVWDTAGRGTAGHAEPDGLLTGHTDWINVMLISPDNHWLASGGDDRTVRFWDVRRGVAGTVLTDAAEPDALVVPEAAARSRARACAAVGDGRFVVAGDEGALRLWDARRGRVQRVWAGEAVAGGAAELVACAADPAEDLYAVADLRGTAALWRSGSDEPVARLVEDHGGPLHCLDLDPESGVLLAGGEHGLRLWERPVLAAAAGSVAEVSTRVEHPGVRAARLTTGATRIVVGDEAGEVHLYARHHLDGATAVRWEARLGRHERPVTALAVSADGRFAASGSDDGEAVLWNLVLGREFRPLDGAFGAVRDLAFDPTSTWLALLGEQAGIEVWDVTAGRPAARLPVDGALRGCCWVDADTLCAVGSRGVHVFALAGFATRAPAVTQRRRGYDVRGGDTTELPGDAIPDDADDRDLPGGVVEGEGVGARVEVAVGGGAVNPVFRVFLGANAWVALAELYPDAATARVFLSGLGLPVGRLPAMTAGMGPETYWFQVCQTVDHGVSATIGLAELAEAAAAEWPRNRTLAALALAARAAESGGQAAG